MRELAQAGSEIVRITVNTPAAAREVPAIREQLDRMGVSTPLVGDFHYNGHRLLTDYPDCAKALSKSPDDIMAMMKGMGDSMSGCPMLR